MIYFQMARFLREEKRNSLELQPEAVRMELADWKANADMGEQHHVSPPKNAAQP
jgi:hypothetical protein